MTYVTDIDKVELHLEGAGALSFLLPSAKGLSGTPKSLQSALQSPELSRAALATMLRQEEKKRRKKAKAKAWQNLLKRNMAETANTNQQ